MDADAEKEVKRRDNCDDSVNGKPKRRNHKPINRLLHEFAGYTTAHGLNRLVESPGVLRKLIWMAFCMGALAMLLFQSYGLFQQYLRRPVATTLTLEHQEGIKFPAVTVCNHNMIRKSRISSDTQKKLGLNEGKSNTNGSNKSNGTNSRVRRDLKKNDPTPVPTAATDTRRRTGDAKTEADKRYRDKNNCFYDPNSKFCDDTTDMGDVEKDVKQETSITYKLSTMPPEVLRQMGHTFESLILECNFKGYNCLNFTKYWNEHWNYRYGNCFTFNSGFDNEGRRLFVKEAHKTGPSHGLKLTLNIEESEYVAELSHDVGARISILPQVQMPFPDDEGISVMPGRVTFIGLRKVCMKSCFAGKQDQHCKCAEVQFQSPNMAPCDVSNKSTENCLSVVKKKFLLGELNCDKECIVLCREEYFKVFLSSSKWPSKPKEKEFLQQLRKKQINMENISISDNFFQVKIYFEQLNYQRIRESVYYKEENLAADIGGQLGLLIGISVLTVCEFIEFAFILIHYCFGRVRKPTKTVSDTNMATF